MFKNYKLSLTVFNFFSCRNLNGISYPKSKIIDAYEVIKSLCHYPNINQTKELCFGKYASNYRQMLIDSFSKFLLHFVHMNKYQLCLAFNISKESWVTIKEKMKSF